MNQIENTIPKQIQNIIQSVFVASRPLLLFLIVVGTASIEWKKNKVNKNKIHDFSISSRLIISTCNVCHFKLHFFYKKTHLMCFYEFQFDRFSLNLMERISSTCLCFLYILFVIVARPLKKASDARSKVCILYIPV